MPRSESTCQQTAHSFWKQPSIPRLVSSAIPHVGSCCKKSAPDLHQHHSEASKTRERIWQPTFEMEKRVLTAQFPARRNVSCTLSQGSTYLSSLKKKKMKLCRLAWTIFTFRLYLAERRVNSTDLSSLLIFFMFSWYFCHAEESSTAADKWKHIGFICDDRPERWCTDGTPSRGCRFSSCSVGSTQYRSKEKPPSPATTRLSSYTPGLSRPWRICAQETEELACERSHQPPAKCASPTK